MLVADHFSTASHREVADLGSNISMPPIAGTSILEGAPTPACYLYTSDAADDTPCVVFCGRRLITKKKYLEN